MEVNEVIHGFTVVSVEEVADCGGILTVMEHEKSGARLAYLKRNDTNKTFSVAFKTVPEDDTGVFHILEHTVLNGSAKYPVREPFVELLKSSMQTFLNAMTFPDKTMYPVSSRNPQDFLNLMDVYLDAVFHPAIYHNPNIFYQEGWHYEIRDPEDEPVYNGVVFNEMKGAFASVDEVIVDAINRLLFKDTCYRFVSGGDPKHIPELTYEQFIETHKRFYHPSNALFFLDGDMDIDTVLSRINDVLQEYDRQEMNITIDKQEILPAAEVICEYEIGPEEEEEDRTMISLAKIAADYQEIDKIFAWNVISEVLTGSNETPLKKAIIDSGLGKDVDIAMMDEILQPYISLNVRNTNLKDKDTVIHTVKDTLRKIVDEGLDREEIHAILNQMEFRYHEPKEPSGLIYAMFALKSWLYGGDIKLYLNCSSVFDELRQKADQGYFEQLIREGLLDDEQVSTVVVVPSRQLGKQNDEEEKARLHTAKESWEDIGKYIELNRNLDEWQAAPDTPEQLATLPQLKLSDVEEKPERIEGVVQEYRGIPVLVYPAQDTGIVYFSLYFALNGIRKEALAEVGEFADLLMSLPTENYTVQQLRQAIRRDLGTLAFGTTAISADHDPDRAIPLLQVVCSVMKKNLGKAVDLILEIIQKTKFEPEMIKPLIAQEAEMNRQNLISAGHAAAVLRTAAQYNASAAAKEYLSGYKSIEWTANLNKNFDEKIGTLIDNLYMYQEVLFNAERLTFSVTGEENLEELKRLADTLPRAPFERGTVRYPKEPHECEGISIPAGIAYSGASADFSTFGGRYFGALRVLSHILTYGYLWNEVRVKGGAYGTSMSIDPSGIATFSSFRDPSPEKTTEVFRQTGEFIQTLADGKEPLDSYIIGAIAAGEPLMAPGTKVRVADMNWMAGNTYEYRSRIRKEMLEAKPEDFREPAEWFREAMKNASVCVVANEDKLKECGELTILNKEL